MPIIGSPIREIYVKMSEIGESKRLLPRKRNARVLNIKQHRLWDG